MNTTLKNRFISDGVAAMSQERLLLALYDRLLIDLDRAEQGLLADDASARDALVHAQQIIEELHLAVDPNAWAGAEQLASIYLFVHGELVQANLRRDPAIVAGCRRVLEPLAESWRDAYAAMNGAQQRRVAGGFDFGA